MFYMNGRRFLGGLSRLHGVMLGVAILCFVFAFVLLWSDGAKKPYIPVGFSYSADLLAAENTYDAKSQRLSGARYSEAGLFYNAVPIQSNEAVRTAVHAATIRGENIGTITRELGVEPETGRYLDPTTLNPSDEFVFAPKHLRYGQSFTTRYVAYDAPANMEFAGEETLFGLDVYRYETRFEGVEHLTPNILRNEQVDTAEGIYQPYLQLWVEPETGWLVKVEDRSTFYEATSDGKRGQALARYVSTFTEPSVRDHASYAATLKYQQKFARQIVPAIIVVALIAVCLFAFMRRYRPAAVSIPLLLGMVFLAAGATLVGWLFKSIPLITLFFDNVALNPLMAMCFIVVGFAVWLLWRRRLLYLVVFLAGLVGIITGLQVLASAGFIPFSLDIWLLTDRILEVEQDVNSRMSLPGAFAMLLLSIGVFTAAWRPGIRSVLTARYAAGIVATLGVVGLFVQFLQVDRAFSLTIVEPISAVSSFLFVLLGIVQLKIMQGYAPTNSRDARNVMHDWMVPALATIPMIIIAGIAQFQLNAASSELSAKFTDRIAQIERALDAAAQSRADFLNSASGLFDASMEVEREEWSKFVARGDLETRFPDFRGLAYSRLVKSDELASYVAEQREKGAPHFNVFPDSGDADHVLLTFIAPHNRFTEPLLGFNLYSDDVHSETIDRVRDGGDVSISGRVEPISSIAVSSEVAFLMMAPLYQPELSVGTPQERQAAFKGVIGTGVNMEQFMGDALHDLEGDVDLEVYSGLTIESSALLFDRFKDASWLTEGEKPRAQRTLVMYVQGQPWTLRVQALPSFRLSSTDERLPTVILLVGAAGYITVLLGVDLTRVKVRTRRRQEKVDRG